MFKKLIFILPLAISLLAAAPVHADALDEINTGTLEEPTTTQTDNLPVVGTTAVADVLWQPAPGEINKIADDHCTYEGDIAIECPAECFNEDGEFLEGCRRKEDGTYVVESTQENTQENPESSAETTDESEENSFIAKIKNKLSEIADPETWPLILSATALVLTILLIIIINLVAHRKSRKIREEIDK